MKILSWHAKNLKIKVGVGGKTKRKKQYFLSILKKKLGNALPELNEKNRFIEAGNALLVLSCTEKDDESLDLKKPRDAIIRIRAMLGVTDIVLSAFGHLSERPAQPMIARAIVDQLYELIKAQYPQTVSVPFGWDKGISMEVPLHHYNCGFLSFDAMDPRD
jgi:hypothetical protein